MPSEKPPSVERIGTLPIKSFGEPRRNRRRVAFVPAACKALSQTRSRRSDRGLRMRIVRLLTVALVLIFVPTVSAQGPTTGLEIDGGPARDVVSTRGVAIVSFNVTLRVANVVCSSASTFSVDVLGGAEQ